MFITFEGIDGSGKTTQARLLAERLRADGQSVVLTREPGGTKGAENIRDLLVKGWADKWSTETEILLFTAARRDHLEKTIWPALEGGKIVISDRFADSTRVYQGAARNQNLMLFDSLRRDIAIGKPRDLTDELHSLMIGTEPDLTFIVDMDVNIAAGRAKVREDSEERFERFGVAFQQKLRAGFLALADEPAHRGRCYVINGDQEPEAVLAEVLAALNSD